MTALTSDPWERMAQLDQEEMKLAEMREKLNEPEPPRVDPEELPPVSGAASTSNAASAAAAAPQVKAPSVGAGPEVLNVLEQLVDEVLEDPAFKAVVDTPTLATTQMLEALASNLRALTRGDVAADQLARAKFEQAFAGTAAHAASGPAYDAAAVKPSRYVTLKHLGIPENAADVTEGSPASRARRVVYDSIHRGGLSQSFATLCSILRTNPYLLGGPLEYSIMDESAAIGRVPVVDATISHLREEIELHYRIADKKKGEVGLEFSKDMVNDALEFVASERPYHAIKEYLASLPAWDGVRRLDLIASELLGAEAPLVGDAASQAKTAARNGLARAQVRKTFIAGVARAQEPGCKVDTVLILKGKQGKRKSEWFRTVTPVGRFSDDDIDIHTKDVILLIRKVWIVEWSELSVMRSAKDTQSVKGFLSRRKDIFRPPYGARMIERDRHTIFVGTTNDESILSDDTGSRRFWVVEADVEKIDLAKTAQWRDQLWAEALVAYKSGEQWWLDDDQDAVREEVNDKHRAVDPWEESIDKWLDGQTMAAKAPAKQGLHPAPAVDTSKVTMSQVLDVLEVPVERRGKGEERRVGAILRARNYVRREVDGKKAWVKATANVKPVKKAPAPVVPPSPPSSPAVAPISPLVKEPAAANGGDKPQESRPTTDSPLPPLQREDLQDGVVPVAAQPVSVLR